MRRRGRRRWRIKKIIYATVAAILIAAIVSVFFYAVFKDSGTQERVAAEDMKTTKAPNTAIMAQVAAAPEPTEAPFIKSMNWDADEAYILAKIAMAEAEGEDTEGKALVILTVLNRVWSPQFPGTIEEVITEKNAFSSYSNGRYDRVEPDKDCWVALELVQIEHWDGSRGALYFERTPEPEESTWHSRNLEQLFIHGNHTFYTEKEAKAN